MASDETGMEQVLSNLQALKGLYGLLHRGQQGNENLDEASRALLMRMLDNATQQALLKQAKMLSGPLMSPALERKLSIQPGRRTNGDAEQRLKPIASPSLSLHARDMSRQLKPQSSVRSRDSRHVYDDHRRSARDDHLLARVASNRSSRTAMPRLHPSTPEQRLSWLGPYSSSRVAEPRRSVASGSASRAGHSDRHSMVHQDSEHGDRSFWPSPEHSSRRRSVSRASSTARLLGRATARGAGGSLTLRRIGRMDSGPSMGLTSRHGSDQAGRGAATPRLGQSSPRPLRALDRIDSGSTYSSGSSSSSSASIPSPSTIPTASSTLGASASPCSSSVSVSPWASARPEYTFKEASSTSRSRRRRERQERREGRLRKFKDKLALVFHHHDHHHHHHTGRGKLPWSFLGGMFHHRTTGQDRGKKKSTSRTVVTEPAKRRGGGGGNALFVRRAGEAQVGSSKGADVSWMMRTRLNMV